MTAQVTKKRTRELQRLANSLAEPAEKKLREEVIYSLSHDALRAVLKEAKVEGADQMTSSQATRRAKKLLDEGVLKPETLRCVEDTDADSRERGRRSASRFIAAERRPNALVSCSKAATAGSADSKAQVPATVARRVLVESPKKTKKPAATAKGAAPQSLYQSVTGFLSSILRFGR